MVAQDEACERSELAQPWVLVSIANANPERVALDRRCSSYGHPVGVGDYFTAAIPGCSTARCACGATPWAGIGRPFGTQRRLRGKPLRRRTTVHWPFSGIGLELQTCRL